MCYRCGSKDHWSRVCRAPPNVVAKYHSRRKKFESNFVQMDGPKNTNMEVSDFQEAITPVEDCNLRHELFLVDFRTLGAEFHLVAEPSPPCFFV